MKYFILTVALFGLCMADDVLDVKKRGVQKNPSPLNTIAGNSHQKPENANYVTHQQQQQHTHPGPVYPLAPHLYHQPEGQHLTQQPYNYIQHQQAYQFPFVPQPVVAPKYQLISTKTANGHTQLTLVPQGLVMAHYMPQLVPVQHPQQQVGTTVATPHTNQHYVTAQPQPQAYAHHSVAPQQQYYHPYANPLVTQPSTMFIYTQPAPQLYGNYLHPSNLLYSQAAQQLLHYYQTNPQAKYQLLYGNSHQPNTYQTQLSGTEYEKAPPVSQNIAASQKPETDLNTNEYLATPETSFRPAPVYASRNPANYKN